MENGKEITSKASFPFAGIIALFLILGTFGFFVVTKQQKVQGDIKSASTQAPMPTPNNPACDPNLWQHVYHPDRLKVVEPCKMVTGTVELVRKEPDGDYHIRLKLDREFANLVNERNVAEQRGDLVLEPVCENEVTQSDAVSACTNFKGSVKVPPVGTHVEVVGPYVLDQQHDWMEIHPVTSIVEK